MLDFFLKITLAIFIGIVGLLEVYEIDSQEKKEFETQERMREVRVKRMEEREMEIAIAKIERELIKVQFRHNK